MLSSTQNPRSGVVTNRRPPPDRDRARRQVQLQLSPVIPSSNETTPQASGFPRTTPLRSESSLPFAGRRLGGNPFGILSQIYRCRVCDRCRARCPLNDADLLRHSDVGRSDASIITTCSTCKIGRRYVDSRLAVILCQVNQTIVSAQPDRRGPHRRWSNCMMTLVVCPWASAAASSRLAGTPGSSCVRSGLKPNSRLR